MTSSEALSQAIIDEFVGNAHGNFARVKELLEQHPALVDARASFNETAIQAAAQMRQVEMANYLLERGAPLDICTASMLGMDEQVAGLLQADPQQAQATGAHGFPVLYFPVISGERGIAQRLLEYGADVNAGRNLTVPLHGAALFGQVEMARWLLDNGADVDARDFDGKTPLQVAVARGHTELADLLQEHGATG